MVRAMPFSVAFTPACAAGLSWPAVLCACPMAAHRRRIVETFRPAATWALR
jgi:hypothetical protein